MASVRSTSPWQRFLRLSPYPDNPKRVYIAYMGALPKRDYSPLAHHRSILEAVLENSLSFDSLVHSYKKSFNGFAAKLTDIERQKLAGMEGIVSVFPSTTYELHTTRSWDFMGFKENVERVPTVESDVIVGVIDTGIWPEAESFSDIGLGLPPKKWKGTCDGGQNFTCNNKVIGARYYKSAHPADNHSARDSEGHGTHTASTAAGNQVNNVSFYGLAQGNTRGAVPLARIAVYKVCWSDGCEGADILAAFDDAITDGVDIISISMGPRVGREYIYDVNAIGAFHAMKKGILTSNSAGNSGPTQGYIGSTAPWTLTVAASSTDRLIVQKVILGDNTTFVGRGLNPYDMKGKKFPLVDGGFSYWLSDTARLSTGKELDDKSLEGKIVFYTGFSTGESPLKNKAAGMILANGYDNDYSETFPLPAAVLNISEGETVQLYINKTKSPVASIPKPESLKDANAPVVALFSSRGPNFITKGILKPDITAPGIDILAATSTNYYRLMSGTSMACPHATGAAAYVKTFHPDWSPSAIKSALMTTAFPLDVTRNPDAEFSFGAGHIDPVRALNPGLVYEAFEADYIKVLCSLGYTADQIKLITGDKSSCPKNFKGSQADLNYPSMMTAAPEANFPRTVTNVGVANSTYTATITSPSNMKVSVRPKVLSFKSLYEKQSFVVTLSTKPSKNVTIYSASLVWSDKVHVVRSPIVVHI